MSSYFEPGRGDAIKVINGVKVRGGYRYDGHNILDVGEYLS